MNNLYLEYAIHFYAWAGLVVVIILTTLLGFLCFASLLEWICDKWGSRYLIAYAINLMIGITTSKIPYRKGDKSYVLAQLEHRFWLMATENPDLARDFIRIVHRPKTKEHRELFSRMFGIKLLETMDEVRVSLTEDNKESPNESEED